MSDDPLAPTPPNGSGEPGGTYVSNYFETRLAHNANRTKIWQHLCNYLQRWIRTDADVLELGAGRCDFSNNVKAKRVVAMDMDAIVARAAAEHVEPVIGDCTNLGKFGDAEFDVVFASNLLEHLDRGAAGKLLSEAMRVLRPRGRLILMQPNFRLNPGRYFDDFTHVAIYTDQSLSDYLVSEGWKVEVVKAKFMPLTLTSKGGNLTFVVPWYLRSPIKPLAGQMLVVSQSVPTMSQTTNL